MTSPTIPKLSFRIDPGYTFHEALHGPNFSNDDLIIGGFQKEGNNNCIFLGKVAEFDRNKNLWLDCNGAHAIFVMGKRRSGKTYSLGNIIEGLTAKNWIKQGNFNQAVVVLDTMNVFVTMPYLVEHTYAEYRIEHKELKNWKLPSENYNIIFFYPRGTNPPQEGRSKEITIRPSDLSASDWAALFGVDTYSDPLGQIITDVYEKTVVTGYLNDNRETINANQNYAIVDLLNCLLGCIDIQNDYKPETIRAAVARFRAIERSLIFSETGVNIKDIFKPDQLSILLLRDIDMDLRSLLIGILVKKIMVYRSESEKYERLADTYHKKCETLQGKNHENSTEFRRRYEEYSTKALEGLSRGWIIIDEAHNYMPSKGIIPSVEPLRKYVNEGRNLGLSIVVATQNPAGLDPAIRRNADISIIHSISMKDDIIAAEGIINTFIPDSFEFGREKISNRVFEQLLRSLPLGYAVISNDTFNRIFVAKLRPRITIHGGMDY
jgi:hypothetical protein